MLTERRPAIWRLLPLFILCAAVWTGGPAMADEPCAPRFPPMYMGKWTGGLGKGESQTRTQTGTAVVVVDFGHILESFEFEVAEDGKVTGKGTAIYRFLAYASANLIAAKVSPSVELTPNPQKMAFTISGTLSRWGKLRLEAKPANRLTRTNVGNPDTMDAWNVFGGVEAEVEVKDGKLVADAFGVTAIDGKTMKLSWSAKSDAPAPVQKAKLPARVGDRIPKDWVGRWEGSGWERSKKPTRIATADVMQDLGAVIDHFDIDIDEEGKVTGSGEATYWFDIWADADLLLARQSPYARLDGNVQQIDFDISGTMTSDGKLHLVAAPKKDLKRIDPGGGLSDQGAWNVFGGIEGVVQSGGGVPNARAAGEVQALRMKFEWRARKKMVALRGRVLHRVFVPRPQEANNVITPDSKDWAGIGPRTIAPAGKVHIEASFVDFLQPIDAIQPDEVPDLLAKTDTDDHGCFELLVPVKKGKTLRLRTTYASNDAILKEHCFIDLPMSNLLWQADEMVGLNASEPVKFITRKTHVWLRYKGDLKQIDLGSDPRPAVLRKYPGEPLALDFNALNSILVNTFILKAGYVNQNPNPINLTGVKVPAKALWDLLPADSTDEVKTAVRTRLGPGANDEIPEETTTEVKIIGGEVCYPSSTAMAMSCLGKKFAAADGTNTSDDAADGIKQIGQGCYDYFYTTKHDAAPTVFPYLALQYDVTRWPYKDHAEPTAKANDQKWLVTCKDSTIRPWQNSGPTTEPYLCGYVKNQFSIDSTVQGDPPKNPYNIFDSSSDATVLQKLGLGGPAAVSINHYDYNGGQGGHLLCLLGAVIDNTGRVKRLIFHDPYGDQSQHPDVQGYYDGVDHDAAGAPAQDSSKMDKDGDSSTGPRKGVKGRYAPYSDPDINCLGGHIESKYVVWWKNPDAATAENMRPRLLPSEFPLTKKP